MNDFGVIDVAVPVLLDTVDHSAPSQLALGIHPLAAVIPLFVKVVVVFIYTATFKSPPSFSGFSQTCSGR
ncbi:hypothetical protein, partial [Nitrosomonas halophila]|uniref:hypothetical protein n=1 Tax=Nitrosomonas halophila TaxID=44576 RepID=UPI001C40936B